MAIIFAQISTQNIPLAPKQFHNQRAGIFGNARLAKS
jgi:hypothetical protein